MIERPRWGGLAVAGVNSPPEVAILGLPYDGSACWRPGAAEAPGRIREISATSPAVSEDGELVGPDRLRLLDLDDVVPDAVRTRGGAGAEAARQAYFAAVQEKVTALWRADRDVFLLTLGGDHSVTIPLVRGFAATRPGPFGLVALDAHPDLFDVYDGSSLANACPLRRALETGRLPPERLLILGTRSYNPVELRFMAEHGIRFVPARELDRLGVPAVVALAQERLQAMKDVYLTVDIDVADPACAPGTGAPVAGGLSSRQTLDLVRGLLEGLPVTAMDLVEVAPPLDPTHATLFLALQLVFETFAVLARRRADVDRRRGQE